MSVLNWLVVFVIVMKTNIQANALYGLLALVGILFAHLGTNLFDDCVDYILKVPKQKCKTEYLDNGFTTIKTVFAVTVLYFCIAFAVGIFFYIKFGNPVLYLIIPPAIMILTYPKLNNYALGELAVGLCFGVFLFAGVSYVMTSNYDTNTILISVPVSLLTVAVLYAHSLMDFDFDKKSGKYTVCQLLKTTDKALLGLIGIYFAAFGGTFWLIINHILPKICLITLFIFPLIIKLYFQLKKYNDNPNSEKNDFKKNFNTARNISLFYNLILVFVYLIKG